MLTAKMTCHRVDDLGSQERVTFGAVYDANPESPNHEWSKATPAGMLELYISNDATRGKIERGKSYHVTISEPVE